MSAIAIIVSFSIGSADAVYCTREMPYEQAQVELLKIIPNGDSIAWKKAHPGLTPPNIIVRGHPNYTDALNGKIMDDPLTGTSKTVPPCAPFPQD